MIRFNLSVYIEHLGSLLQNKKELVQDSSDIVQQNKFMERQFSGNE